MRLPLLQPTTRLPTLPRSSPVQNYYASDLYGMPNESSNTAWIRFVKPIGKVLLRASLPLSTVPSVGNDSISGIGDLNMFAAYLMTDPSAPQQYGIGPLVAAPTASDDALGVDAWQAGAAAVYFNLSSPDVQWGGLVTWQTDISGDDNTNLAIAQPMLFIQMGKGTYLRSSAAWTFDMEQRWLLHPRWFRDRQGGQERTECIQHVGSSPSSPLPTMVRATPRFRSSRASTSRLLGK